MIAEAVLDELLPDASGAHCHGKRKQKGGKAAPENIQILTQFPEPFNLN